MLEFVKFNAQILMAFVLYWADKFADFKIVWWVSFWYICA